MNQVKNKLVILGLASAMAFSLNFSSLNVKAVSFSDRVIELVNQQRQNRGLSTLKKSNRLSDIAGNYSNYMAQNNWLSHEDKNGKSYSQRLADGGYNGWSTIGENIARGQETPEEVVDSWMNSPMHRSNILDPNFCDLGVGYSYTSNDNYRHYWVQAFGCGGDNGGSTSQQQQNNAPQNNTPKADNRPEYYNSYIKVRSNINPSGFSTCVVNSQNGEIYTEKSFGFPYDFKIMLYRDVATVPVQLRVVNAIPGSNCANAKTVGSINFDVFSGKDDAVDVIFK